MRVVRFARPLLRLWPFQAGKERLVSLLDVKEIPEGTLTRMKVGVTLRLHEDPMYRAPFLYGEYEALHTRLIQSIIRPGDVCLDIGANFGYYSALFSKLVGATGKVHGFEPVPAFYALAQETIELNGASSIAKLHNVGLGSATGTFTVYTFSELAQGFASSSDLNRTDTTPHLCSVTTLDKFVEANAIRRVDLMKVDVEGDELNVFLGGKQLLSTPFAPAITFEINTNCLSARALTPDDVQAVLAEYGYCTFFRIPHRGRIYKVAKLLNFSSDYVAFKPDRLRRLADRRPGMW